MKPTILFLEQQSWRAGAQRVLDSVLDALIEDYDLLVAFPHDGPYAQHLRSRGIKTIYYPLGRYRSGRKSFFEIVSFAVRSARCMVQLARLVRGRRITLIYINAPRALPAGALAARATRTPAIFHLHRTLTNRADLFATKGAAAYVKRIIACSQAAAGALTAAAPGLARRTKVVYNSVETTAALAPSGAPPSTRRVIGLVGRITPQKGHLTLLQAVARLGGAWPDLRVVFVGAPDAGNVQDAAYLQQLQSVVYSLGLGHKVRFAGYQADPNLFYRQFDVLAAPSLESEGLPMAVLEAASWGVPAVASRVAGMTEVISDGWTGRLVATGDIDAWADTLRTLLLDSHLRRRWGEAARQRVAECFSPELFRNCIRRITAEVCGARAGDADDLDPLHLADRKTPKRA